MQSICPDRISIKLLWNCGELQRGRDVLYGLVSDAIAKNLGIDNWQANNSQLKTDYCGEGHGVRDLRIYYNCFHLYCWYVSLVGKLLLFMHPYLPHLLNDIAAAHRGEIPVEEKRPNSFEEEMMEIEKWVSGEDAEHTFGYYCGLEAADFPPSEQLTDAEKMQVIQAFERMMFSWNHGIDLPKTLPPAIAYTMTIDTLNMKTAIVNSGMMSFDFCSGYAPGCVFKNIARALKYGIRKAVNDKRTEW